MNAAPPIEPADVDPLETREWLEALEAVIAREGPERAHFLLEELIAPGIAAARGFFRSIVRVHGSLICWCCAL